ncbi:trypsin-like peptidase domain-containing protein [Streptomyces ficellus]|uniref:Trypsin-like peptidase domain-containing protein n=1 Tax=Streptomyces ficellus TaxID=1977088 RepID=A0ABT7ZC02_9ACTN|nr:trypsin-like peptidase domain-containing protein [Streptomyces ficellus]MDN3297024.1 trypsin-like peptidase domain-containing protein [Streptomyces ficellus]
MADAHTDLDALVRAATVRFLPADPADTHMWGSGFLVAPGWALTCAHVLLPHLRDDPGRAFRVAGSPSYYGIDPVGARLEKWLVTDPWDDEVPAVQDLALVRLLDDGVEHECVWIGDQVALPVGTRQVYGFRPEDDPGQPYELWTSRIAENTSDGRCSIRFAPMAEFPPGVSGGPVLDPVSGGVVAITKSGRYGKDGGRAVLLRALRAFGPLYRELIAQHDHWHAGRADSRGSWLFHQQRLPDQGAGGDDGWSPGDRVAALRLLAQLPDPPPPGVVETLVQHVRQDRQERVFPSLAAWRDGHGLLYRNGRPLPAVVFLHYLRQVVLLARSAGGKDAAAPAVDELDAWITKRLERVESFSRPLVIGAQLPEPLREAMAYEGGGAVPAAERIVVPYPGRGDTDNVVVVEIEPLPYRNLHWQIRIDDGSGDEEVFAAEADPDGVEPAGLLQRLRRPLDEAFQFADGANGHPAACEVVLPVADFDTPVHRWQLAEMARLGDAAHLPLGVRRRVVLRDLARRGRPDDAWTRRWEAMTAAGRLAAARTPPLQQAPRRRHFTAMAASHIPVLCRPAGRGAGRKAMELALETGHGIVLWHIEGHPRSTACAGDCDAFHQGAAELLGKTATARELPDRLRRIREEIHERRDQGHWAEAVAVLYDDPGRPVPAGPLGLWSSPA